MGFNALAKLRGWTGNEALRELMKVDPIDSFGAGANRNGERASSSNGAAFSKPREILGEIALRAKVEFEKLYQLS